MVKQKKLPYSQSRTKSLLLTCVSRRTINAQVCSNQIIVLLSERLVFCTEPQPVTDWRLHCCRWAETPRFPPSAPGTQSRLMQGSSPDLHRYTSVSAQRRQKVLQIYYRVMQLRCSIHQICSSGVWYLVRYLFFFLISLQRQKGHSSRAHSAVNNEAGSSLPRDRHHLLDVFSRPSTTHTYRVRHLGRSSE